MLDEKMRGSLELIIDQVVTSLPQRLYLLQRGEAAALQVKNESDYTLGFAHGAIRPGFHSAFIMLRGRPPNDEEAMEAESVTYNRTPELRNAIFKSG